MDGSPIGVLVVHDDEQFRLRLMRQLDASEEISVVACLAVGMGVVEWAVASAADVAVIGHRAGDHGGLNLTAALALCAPGIRTLLLTDAPGAGVVQQAVAAGAAGVLTSACDPRVLVAACRAAGEGCVVLDPRLLSLVPPAPLAGVLGEEVPGPRESGVRRVVRGAAPRTGRERRVTPARLTAGGAG